MLPFYRMSDAFADLWASSAPTQSTPQPPPKKISSTVPPRRQQYDTFSVLSASQPASKPVVNNRLNDRQGRRPQATSRGGDAFSDLFASSRDGTETGRNSDRARMTIAERASLAQRAKGGAVQTHAAATQIEPVASSNSLWDGLDTLARPATASPRPNADPAVDDTFDFGFDEARTAHLITKDDWGLSGFASRPSESQSAPAPAKPVSKIQPTTLWDLDEFGSSDSQTSPLQRDAPSSGDFDFGDREDGLLGGDSSDGEDTFGIAGGHPEHPEDDILGDLGKPLSHSHSSSPNPPSSTRDPNRPSRTTVSPPPHITGQLVEMGFSPVDAHTALVNTMSENGFDVQAATELLLSQANQDGPSSRLPERERRRNSDRPGGRDQATRGPPPARVDSQTQSPNASQSHPQSQSQPQPQLDLTAEKFLNQASEIGRGMFNKANALWKEGKERAVKMYEERAAAAANTSNGVPGLDGRPRWMRDRDDVGVERQLPGREAGRNPVQAEFKDEDEEEGREQEKRQNLPARRHLHSEQLQSLSPSQLEREQEVDLFSHDSLSTVYQSPFRRRKPKQAIPSVSSSLSPLTQPTYTPTFTLQGPSTSQLPRTFRTTINSSSFTTSASHKSTGSEAYKRGDFPVSLTAYMHAVSALPPQHILRVPILTNVALVRTKLGELRDAIKACEEAVILVRRFVSGADGGGGVGEEMLTGAELEFDEKTPLEVGTGKVSVTVQGDSGDLSPSVDLIEGLSKAFRRRAEALEGLEKWESARSTWEVLLGAEWVSAGTKGEAIKGVGRCRKMVIGSGAGQGPPSASSYPQPKPSFVPRPKATPRSSASPLPSAALTALRSTHDAQQTEDTARLECKDAVDARLAVWKSGREGNIRALLTSLDETVLWPELGLRKVGMAEVVSKGQVKGAYVRAIARVHPDKLNTGNTTVEQRMIANGVFGALNEAWNAFQQQ